jgi:hypothetical protein
MWKIFPDKKTILIIENEGRILAHLTKKIYTTRLSSYYHMREKNCFKYLKSL